MSIKNQSTIHEEQVENMRSALEHRATWFYLLLDEARNKGLDWDDFARKAISRCGCFHGKIKYTGDGDMKKFAGELANELYQKIFEMEVKEVTENRFVVEFSYCPLLAAWMKLTRDDQELKHLCDIAMDGDRGIASQMPGFTMDLQETIAAGGKHCRMVFTKQ
jgi:hypothetical protein